MCLVIASYVSGASICLLFSPRTSLKTTERFDRKFIFSRSCFHLFCCSCWISAVSTLLLISGEVSPCAKMRGRVEMRIPVEMQTYEMF